MPEIPRFPTLIARHCPLESWSPSAVSAIRSVPANRADRDRRAGMGPAEGTQAGFFFFSFSSHLKLGTTSPRLVARVCIPQHVVAGEFDSGQERRGTSEWTHGRSAACGNGSRPKQCLYETAETYCADSRSAPTPAHLHRWQPLIRNNGRLFCLYRGCGSRNAQTIGAVSRFLVEWAADGRPRSVQSTERRFHGPILRTRVPHPSTSGDHPRGRPAVARWRRHF